MQTTGVGSSTTTAQTTAVERGVDSMSSDDFFKLLVTELQNQDPLKPAETADMLTQVAQIRSIQNSKDLTEALDSLAQSQHLAGTSDLLGKFVTAQVPNDDGTVTETTGVVTGVRYASDGGVILELDSGQTVNAQHVVKVQANESADSKASTAQTKAVQQQAASAVDQTKQSAAKAVTTDPAASQKQAWQPFSWLKLDGAFQL